MVIIAGSADSEIARVVKQGTAEFKFFIGRNIILFGYHIHHFYFGILLIGIAGWLAIAGNSHIKKERLALIYGTGLGLLMDEIGLLLTWGEYYSSLTYLLCLLLAGILLNVTYFPDFWKKTREDITEITIKTLFIKQIIKFVYKQADRLSEFIMTDNRRFYLLILTLIFIIMGIVTWV